MRPDLTFREVQESDFTWLLELRRATINPHLRAAGFEPLEKSHREAVETDYEWTQIIRIEDKDIGMTRLVKKDNPWHLRHFQILPEYQGQGIGRLVLEGILEQARLSGAHVVLNVLKVNPAHRLYSRLGFEVVGGNETAYKMEWGA